MVLLGCLAVWIISMIKQRLTVEVNPQVEKSFRNFLETIVMHVIGILATFVMFTSCDMKIGLRNDHIVMPALKREGDDPRNQPTYADPSVYDLNRPWIIERKERLPIDVDTFTKVWVMGSYKVGKTSLLIWLGPPNTLSDHTPWDREADSSRAVTQFFLGSMSYLQDWNMVCVRELASRLRHVQTQAFPLIRTLQESLCLVASSTYAFGNTENGNVTCEVAEECNEAGEIYKFHRVWWMILFVESSRIYQV